MAHINIQQLKSRKCDLEYALINLSDAKQALHYQQTCDMQNLQIKYDGEEELIDAQFEGMDETDYDKQIEKLTLKYELNDKRKNEEEQIRSKMSKKETDLNRHQEMMETQLEAVQAELENMQKARDKFIEQECAYFKNEK